MIKKRNKKLFVFILAYNHKDTIIPVLERIPKDIWKRSSEILVADDASKDETYKIAFDYKKKNRL